MIVHAEIGGKKFDDGLIGNLLACLLIIPFLHASAQRSACLLYEQIALSEMKRFPELWQLDHGKRLYFAYSQGLGALAFYKLYEKTKNEVYFNYVETWMDSLIGNKGEIYLYKPEDFHLDFINPGMLLFLLYEKTKKDRILEKTIRKHLLTACFCMLMPKR